MTEVHIILEDAIEGLSQLDDNSVGLILTDPPYFLDKLSDDWKAEAVRTKKTTVTSLPSGMKFSRKQSYEFEKFFSKVSNESFRVLKPGGFFLSFSAARLYHRMVVAVEDSGFEIRDMMAWIYPTGQAKAAGQAHVVKKNKTLGLTDEEKENLIQEMEGWKTPQLRPAIEPICFAQKPRQGTFVENWAKYKTGLINTKQILNNGKTPTNVVSEEEFNDDFDRLFLVQKPKKDSFNKHPTVKPSDLCLHLIKLLTIPEELVVDPFLGSGSTAVAALACGRSFIGFDTNPYYIEIAEKRVGL